METQNQIDSGTCRLLVTPHEQYLGIARNADERREHYCALFKAHLDPEVITKIRTATNGNVVLGDKRFEDQIEKMLKRRVTLGKAGRPKRVEGREKELISA